MSHRFGVTVLCGGRDDFARACLLSIRKNSVLAPYVVLVCDGWTAPADLRELAHGTIRIGEPGKWSGISRGWNAGVEALRAADCDLICVQNDDTWLGPRWDWLYADCLDRNPAAQVACAVDRSVAAMWFADLIPWSRDDAWAVLAPNTEAGNAFYGAGGFDAFATAWVKMLGDKGVPAFLPCRMNGSSFVCRREVFDEIGLFDESFAPPGTWEDYDFWMRLLARYGPAGMGCATRVFMHHWRGATLGVQPRRWVSAANTENGRIFARKWRSTPANDATFRWLAGDRPADANVNALPWRAPLPASPGGAVA